MVTGDDIGECIEVLAGLVLVMYAKPLKNLRQANESWEMIEVIRWTQRILFFRRTSHSW
jgi:hypothetical protein